MAVHGRTWSYIVSHRLQTSVSGSIRKKLLVETSDFQKMKRNTPIIIDMIDLTGDNGMIGSESLVTDLTCESCHLLSCPEELFLRQSNHSLGKSYFLFRNSQTWGLFELFSLMSNIPLPKVNTVAPGWPMTQITTLPRDDRDPFRWRSCEPNRMLPLLLGWQSNLKIVV